MAIFSRGAAGFAGGQWARFPAETTTTGAEATTTEEETTVAETTTEVETTEAETTVAETTEAETTTPVETTTEEATTITETTPEATTAAETTTEADTTTQEETTTQQETTTEQETTTPEATTEAETTTPVETTTLEETTTQPATTTEAEATPDYVVSGATGDCSSANGDYYENGTCDGVPAYEKSGGGMWLYREAGVANWVVGPTKCSGTPGQRWYQSDTFQPPDLPYIGEYVADDGTCSDSITVAAGA